MNLPQDVNLLVNDLKQDKYLLEWQLFGNSTDDVRLELTWWKRDTLLLNEKDENWKLRKSSQPIDESPKLFADVVKTPVADSRQTSGTEDVRDSVASEEKRNKATKEVDVPVVGKEVAIADSQGDAASRRQRLHKSNASLDSNIACGESTKWVLERNIMREDSFTRKGGKKSPFRKLKKDEKLPSTGRLHISLSVDHLDTIIPHENSGSIVHSVVRKILGEYKPDVKAKSQVNKKIEPKAKIGKEKLDTKFESKSDIAAAKLASQPDGKRESKGKIVEKSVKNLENSHDEERNPTRQIVKEKKREASSKENSSDESSAADIQNTKAMNLDLNVCAFSATMNGTHDQCDDSLGEGVSQIILSRQGSLGRGSLTKGGKPKDRTKASDDDEDDGNDSRLSSDPAKEGSCVDKNLTEQNSSRLELSNGEAERNDLK